MFLPLFYRNQYREGKKLKPKPNYNSVDLSEVEWEDQTETVSGHCKGKRSQMGSVRALPGDWAKWNQSIHLFWLEKKNFFLKAMHITYYFKMSSPMAF